MDFFTFTREGLFGYAAVLMLGLAFAGLGFFLYPLLEKVITSTIQARVRWTLDIYERMFKPIPPRRALLLTLIPPLVLAALGLFLASGQGSVTFFITLLFGCFGYFLPRIFITLQWQRRLGLFDRQLIDGLNLMSNSIKSGLNLNQVIQTLVREMPTPLSQEFGLVLSQEKLGLTIDEALGKMAERLPSQDLRIAIHSILILRETGGDLSETFDVIASTIRERRKVDGKINAMTQQGKMQGLLLILMPFVLGLLLYVFNPGFLEPLFSSKPGWILIGVMLLFQTIGALWIKKIITIDI